MARQISKGKKFTSYAVLGDGQTEQYYLEHLKKIKGFKYLVRPRLFKSITIEQADKLIQEMLKEGYDMVVYFTDYDTIVQQGKTAKFNKIVAKYQKRSDVLICESMPSIEFWFLLHYLKTTRNFQSADEVLITLKRYIPDFSKDRSFLENIKWVENLCQDDKLTTALVRSGEILAEKEQGHVGEYFPYTKIGEGIEWFERKSK